MRVGRKPREGESRWVKGNRKRGDATEMENWPELVAANGDSHRTDERSVVDNAGDGDSPADFSKVWSGADQAQRLGEQLLEP